MKKIILKIILGTIFILVYPIKVKNNKITFISYKSDKVERDFKLISDELNKRGNYKLEYVLIKFENTLMGNVKYLINCIQQVYHVNTSKVVILDFNNYVVSNFKKESVKVLQVWHASGAIKRFGCDVNREYPIKNYDYVLSTSDEWKKPYSSAFNVKEDNVLSLGIPLNDKLFSKTNMSGYRKKMVEKYPQVNKKKVVLYAPTFRGSHLKNTTYQPINLDYIQKSLGNEYILIYKLHPYLEKVILCEGDNVINANKESITKLFSIADYLITDYSSILFDFTILNRPIISFVPDIEQYRAEVGMYIDYEKDIPAPICKTEQEIIDVIKINKFDFERIDIFKDKYFKDTDGKATKRVVDFVEELVIN